MPTLSQPKLKEAVEATFQKYDIDRNGRLEQNEIIPMLQDAVNYLGKNYTIDESDVKGFMQIADINHNKKL